MSRRIGLYSAYGVSSVVTAMLSVVYLIVSLTRLSDSLIGWALSGSVELMGMEIYFIIAVTVVSIILAFIGYVECSSSLTFAELLKHEESKIKIPFAIPGYAMSARAYSSVATVIAVITFIASVLIFVFSHFLTALSTFIPAAVFIGMSLINLYTYIVVYNRYKYFSDILSYEAASEKTGGITASLQLNNTDFLKGYGIFTIIYIAVEAAVSLTLTIIAFVMKHNGNYDYISLIFGILLFALTAFKAFALGFFTFDIKGIIDMKDKASVTGT